MDLSEVGTEVVRRHPWEVSRSRFFLGLLEERRLTRSSQPILDIGAGDAWFARELSGVLPSTTDITCWDVNYAESGSSVIEEAGDLILTAERPPGRFHGVLMLDVIEHIEKDVEFVRMVVHDLLEVDSWVLVSVPAYQGLYTSHDTALRHFRRYSPPECRDVLSSAGLVPVLEGGLFQSLLLVRGLQALRERFFAPPQSHGIGAWEGGELVTRQMTRWLDLEGRFSLRMATKTKILVPGLSYWALCTQSGR